VLLLGAVVALAARINWYIPRPLIWLGEVSYSIYLVHTLVLGSVGRATESLLPYLPWALRLALVPLLLALSSLPPQCSTG
jgi:peptidoglycan/LPS O-acetylase OafA/YrhL